MIDYIINEPKMLGDNQLSYILGTCLSTDAKPVLGIYFNSMLFETDTQRWYVFDKTKVWKKSSGGGGGTTVVANPELAGTEDDLTGLQVEETKYKIPSGGSGVLVVTQDENGILNKTWKEITDAGFSILMLEMKADLEDSSADTVGYETVYYSGYVIRDGTYMVMYDGGNAEYITTSENGYPVYCIPDPDPTPIK